MKRRPIVLALGALVTVSVLTVGCGGISGSHSVSPASFFMPGLIEYRPTPPDPTFETPTPIAGSAEKPIAS